MKQDESARLSPLQSTEDDFHAVRSLADLAPFVVWLSDTHGNAVYFNHHWNKLVGRASDEQVGNQWLDMIHPEDRERLREAVAVNAMKGSAFVMEARIRCSDGAYRWHESGGTARFGEGRRFVGYFGTWLDVHDRKEIEKQLRESRYFLQNVVDDLPVALFCKDADNDFSFSLWNRRSEEVFGLKKDQVLGKNDYDFFSHEQADFFRKKDEETLAGVGKLDIPEEAVGNRLVHTLKVPVKDLTGRPRYLLGISEDITERKRTEAKLIHTSKMSTLGEMAGGIAHEINNPLAIITLKTGQIRAGIARGGFDLETFRGDLDKIEATAIRIAKIIKGLRAFSRNSDQDPFQTVALSQVIDDSQELCRERFRNNAIELRLPTEVVGTIHCRPSQISQVLLNVLNNAFDAVEGREEAWVSLDVDVTKDWIVIGVSDSGAPIPPKVIERMMQPFFTTKEVGKGTGLGLSIAKGLCEEHRGTLEFDENSKNTRFVIRLPRISTPAVD